MKTTYRGSCFCRAATFEADIDLEAGTEKCNCTLCFKRRWWYVHVQPEDFRALTGTTDLVLHQPGAQTRGGFCKTCGILVWYWNFVTEWNPAERVSVSVAALDDVDPELLARVPVKHLDGKNDNWWAAPTVTRHL
jgi:hypothetical protein